MSKNLDSQETAKTIANIETSSELTFEKDPGKAFEDLEKYEKEHKGNLAIENKIKALREKFGNEMARMAADAKKAAEMASEQKEPRYPDDLSAIVEANSQSTTEEKDREGWIMSVSKSFCGATAALMAADGKFGEKGVSVTLAQLLSHRNGLIQQGSYFTSDPQFIGNNPGVIASEHVKFMPEKVGTTFSYGNPTFMLAEDLTGLFSDLGSYEKELEERIIKPLNLTHTKRDEFINLT